MPRFLISCAAISGLLSVVLGAFGSHGLRNVLSPSSLATFHTANEYHIVHSLALLALGVLARVELGSSLVKYSGFAFILGIILFSGSLYLLAVSGMKVLGIITPLGGFSFLLGWALLAIYGLKISNEAE